MNENITPGEYIKLTRRRKKLSLQKVESMSGVSIATISRIENDKDALFGNVCAIASALEIPITKLAEMSIKKG